MHTKVVGCNSVSLLSSADVWSYAYELFTSRWAVSSSRGPSAEASPKQMRAVRYAHVRVQGGALRPLDCTSGSTSAGVEPTARDRKR